MTNDKIKEIDYLNKVGGGIKKEDTWFDNGDKKIISCFDYQFYHFKRVSATGITFNNIAFKYCRFEDCYFKNCKFNGCEFVGCFFKDSIFRNADFDRCNFQYVRFEKTIIDFEHIYRSLLLTNENVLRDIARSLKSNYAQIGDFDGYRKSLELEIKTSLKYLNKAVFSNEKYFVDKYGGVGRLPPLKKYIFMLLGYYLWGSGESFFRTVLFIISFLISISVIRSLFFGFDNFQQQSIETFLLYVGFSSSQLIIIESKSIYGLLILTFKIISIAMLTTTFIRGLSRR